MGTGGKTGTNDTRKWLLPEKNAGVGDRSQADLLRRGPRRIPLRHKRMAGRRRELRLLSRFTKIFDLRRFGVCPNERARRYRARSLQDSHFWSYEVLSEALRASRWRRHDLRSPRYQLREQADPRIVRIWSRR